MAGYYGFTLDIFVYVRQLSVRISFPDDNLRKHQCIFTKLGMCIDIGEIWFGIANGQISSNFEGIICLRHTHIFVTSKYQGILTKLGTCINIKEIWFGIANGQISSIFSSPELCSD